MDFNYSGLNACTLVSEPNTSYLYNTHYSGAKEPLSGSTMGLMMILSGLQYQAPYMAPQYQGAAVQAGKSAYIISGGQAFQDQVSGKASKEITDRATNVVHLIGITDAEMGSGYLVYKVATQKKVDLNLPKIGNMRFNLTATLDSASLGLKYGW